MKVYDSDGRVTTDGTGGVTRSYGILGNPYQTKTGRKANHASIQKCVVHMNYEPEKIREQSLSIL